MGRRGSERTSANHQLVGESQLPCRSDVRCDIMTDGHLLSTAWLLSLLGSIWALFKIAETVASPTLKAQVTKWLKSPNPLDAVAGWLPSFVEVFDRLFGRRHFSWSCFGRSCLASVGAVLLVTFYWAATRPTEALAVFVSGRVSKTALRFFVLTVILSLVPDYISLLKSRRLIGWMNRNPRTRHLLVGLAFDLCGTVILVWLSWYAFWLLTWTIQFGWHSPSVEVVLRMPLWLTAGVMYGSYSLSAEPGYFPLGIWPWATLFTAIWAALYAVAGAILKLARFIGLGLSRALWTLDIDAKPIESLGVVSVVVVSALYVIGA